VPPPCKAFSRSVQRGKFHALHGKQCAAGSPSLQGSVSVSSADIAAQQLPQQLQALSQTVPHACSSSPLPHPHEVEHIYEQHPTGVGSCGPVGARCMPNSDLTGPAKTQLQVEKLRARNRRSQARYREKCKVGSQSS
jgi:hypothetical protein